MSTVLWAGFVVAFAAVIGFFIWWIIDRGDPHQK